MYLSLSKELAVHLTANNNILAKLIEYAYPYYKEITKASYQALKGDKYTILLNPKFNFSTPKIEEKERIFGYTVWKRLESDLILFDDYSKDTYFKLNLKDKSIDVFFQNESKIIYDLFRLLRSLVTYSMSPEDVMLHGSCFEVNSKGVLVTGDKFAGKTTVLLEALRKVPNAFFVTNDVGYYSIKEDKYIGIPRSISIRKITIEKLKLKIISNYAYSDMLLKEGRFSKIRISTKDFSDLLEVSLKKDTQIHKIIYLKYGEDFEFYKLCGVQEKIAYLRKQILNSDLNLSNEVMEFYESKLEDIEFYSITMNE